MRPILAPLERLNALAAGDSVRLVDTTLKLRVGPSLCGRVIDAFGQPIDGKPLPQDLMTVDAEREPPESLERPSIDLNTVRQPFLSHAPTMAMHIVLGTLTLPTPKTRAKSPPCGVEFPKRFLHSSSFYLPWHRLPQRQTRGRSGAVNSKMV